MRASQRTRTPPVLSATPTSTNGLPERTDRPTTPGSSAREVLVVGHIGDAATAVKLLTAAVPGYPGTLSEHPFGRRTSWQAIREKITKLSESLIMVMSPADPEPPFGDGEEA